jgi:hypothetical protein
MSETYLIGVGYNVSQGSLVNIMSIDPCSCDDPFASPKALPLYDDGSVEQDLEVGLMAVSFASVVWKFTRLSYDQYEYLKTTYCNGGLSGEVTIYTTLGGVAYYRRNAIMHLKKPIEIRSEYRYQEAEVKFMKLRTAA